MNILEMAMAAKMNGGKGGGGSVPTKDVNFYDYDGTLLYSYTVAEAQALTELPALPTQQGLICQGWNWTLEDMQSYVADYGVCDVGATYITDDGKTRLYITITSEGRMDVPLHFNQSITNGVTINWGDGSEEQTVAGAGNVNATHTYTDIGDYVITLDPNNECKLAFGSNSSSACVIGTQNSFHIVYNSMLVKVEIGNSVTSINSYAFNKCYRLERIVIPNSVTIIDSYSLCECYNLRNVIIPNSVTSIGKYAFQMCHALTSVIIPNSVTSINSYATNQCYSLERIIIPNSVTTIGDNAFASCHALTSVIIPNSVTSIGDTVFSKCYDLTNVIIPNSVTTIGKYMFQMCYNLRNVIIPNSVTSIGNSAFDTCYSIATLVIPNSVTTIGSSVFNKCSGVAFYDFTRFTAIPTLSTNAFSSIRSDCQIRVPAVLYDEWKSATNWSTYASNIVAV